MDLEQGNEKAMSIIATSYAALIILLVAYLNYVHPYSPDPVSSPSVSALIAWTLPYLPLVFIPPLSNWKITRFGFSVSRRILIALIPVVLLCGPIALSFDQVFSTSWQSSLFEAFARSGEEIFFRGFLIYLSTRMLEEYDRANTWAAILSSLIFALIHTQTFQPGYFGSSNTPQAFMIAQRFLTLFLLGGFFALLRIWSHSIFPGVVAHSIVKGGFWTLPISIAIYSAILFWAHCLGEDVFLPIKAAGSDV
jgi:membrane protease YdiL (CAAX protease family)